MVKKPKKRATKVKSKVKDPFNINTENQIDLYEEERLPEVRKTQFINFMLGKERYGVEIANVKAVCRVGEIAYLPCAPSYISGIVSLRGNILSITDLKKIFGLEPAPLTEDSRILVTHAGGFETGIVVDNVFNVIAVSLENIDPPLETLDPERAEYIIGECKVDDIFFAILNVKKIFALAEEASN